MRGRQEAKITAEGLKEFDVPVHPQTSKKDSKLVSASGAFIPVAKTEMICPFSGKLCEECAFYRGRHYYLCFCPEYRGYLGQPGELAEENFTFVSRATSNGKFEMPAIIPTNAIDPFVTDHEGHQKEA